MKKKFLLCTVSLGLLLGGSGAYAGQVIKSYKTVRGTTATIEAEEVHKGRIGLTVNGANVSKPTWYAVNTTYVPLRAVSEMLGAEVNYNSSTQSADLTLPVSQGKYTDIDLDYLQIVTRFNYQHDSIDTIAGSLHSFTTYLRVTADEIHIYGTANSLEDNINFFNNTIDYYNKALIAVDKLIQQADGKGFLLQKDVDGFDSAIMHLSDSIDYYSVAIDHLYNYYSTGSNASYSDYLYYSNKGFESALESEKVIFGMKQSYYDEILTFKGFNVASAANAKNIDVKATKKEVYKSPFKK